MNMGERLNAKLQRMTVRLVKGVYRVGLEFTALVTDTQPGDGGVGCPALPETVRTLFLQTAAVKELTRAALADGIEDRPFAIYLGQEEEEAELEEESVLLEAVRLRRDEKAAQEGRGVITWVDFRVTLTSEEAARWAGKRCVGKWLWLKLK